MTTLKQQVELLPCPFCNGEAKVHAIEKFTDYCGAYKVQCKQCDCQTGMFTAYRMCIEAWNTRHNPDANALKVAVDALREQVEIWAGAEAGEPVYAQEAYAIRLCKQMYDEATLALAEIERIAKGEK